MIFRRSLAAISGNALRFARAEDGNIAVIFAVVLVPLISFVGTAVDFSRVSNARTAMQASLDSAALMLSRDNAGGTLTASQLTAKAQQYVAGLYTNNDAKNVSVSATYTNSSGGGSNILLTGTASVATQFMKIVGFPTMAFGTSSTTTWGMTRMRVALALDTTGSMADDNKMSALQSAAKNLVDQLSANATNNGDVYISLVPFANVVNLGTSFRSSGYIDWSQWSTQGSIEEDYSCGSTNRAPTYNRNGSLNTAGSMKCGSSSNTTSSWNGCVMDRGTATGPGTNTGPDVTVAPPTTSANYYPADQSSYCPQQIAPLTYDWSGLKTAINGMTPSGGTNQPIGLVWAWQTLQQTAPFNAPAEDSAYTYKKAIILLSDGLNTMDRWYGDGRNPSSQVDARQTLLCNNIKAAGVIIYTIQVNTSGDPTSSVLQACASGTGNYFATTTASGISTAFAAISASLSKLRIAR